MQSFECITKTHAFEENEMTSIFSLKQTIQVTHLEEVENLDPTLQC